MSGSECWAGNLEVVWHAESAQQLSYENLFPLSKAHNIIGQLGTYRSVFPSPTRKINK